MRATGPAAPARRRAFPATQPAPGPKCRSSCNREQSMKRRRISYRRMEGAAMVEFAIVLIPLLLLVFGVAEYGHAIYQYDALTKGTRDAARFLSQYSASDQPN